MHCRIAILTPGPSLESSWDDAHRDRYHEIVGVNRAVEMVECDVWVAGDWQELIRRRPRRGRCAVVTLESAVETLHRQDFRTAGWIESRPHTFYGELSWWDAARKGPMGRHSVPFSTSAAVAAAVARGATIVDVYGHDLAGDAYAGGAGGDTGGEDRWRREADEWQRVVAWALGCGCVVRRAGHEDLLPFDDALHAPETLPWADEFRAAGNDGRGLLAVSWFTRDALYEQEARRLRRSLRRLRLPYCIVSSPPSGDDWHIAVRRKAGVLLDLRRRFEGRPLLWVDADAVVHEDPRPHVSALAAAGVDIAAARLGNELLAGTLYLGPGERVEALLSAWAARNVELRGNILPQRVLQYLVDAEAVEGLRAAVLPPELTWIFDISAQRYGGRAPVIEHLQASRAAQPQFGAGELAQLRRRRRLDELEPCEATLLYVRSGQKRRDLLELSLRCLALGNDEALGRVQVAVLDQSGDEDGCRQAAAAAGVAAEVWPSGDEVIDGVTVWDVVRSLREHRGRLRGRRLLYMHEEFCLSPGYLDRLLSAARTGGAEILQGNLTRLGSHADLMRVRPQYSSCRPESALLEQAIGSGDAAQVMDCLRSLAVSPWCVWAEGQGPKSGWSEDVCLLDMAWVDAVGLLRHAPSLPFQDLFDLLAATWQSLPPDLRPRLGRLPDSGPGARVYHLWHEKTYDHFRPAVRDAFLADERWAGTLFHDARLWAELMAFPSCPWAFQRNPLQHMRRGEGGTVWLYREKLRAWLANGGTAEMMEHRLGRAADNAATPREEAVAT